MTLDGVPSPLASRTDQEMEPEDELNMTSELLENDRPKPAVHLRLGTDLVKADSKRNICVSTYRRVTCDGNLTKKKSASCSPSFSLPPASVQMEILRKWKTWMLVQIRLNNRNFWNAASSGPHARVETSVCTITQTNRAREKRTQHIHLFVKQTSCLL